MIAALYVETGGCYYGLPGVDPWDIDRDARLYAGPYPVVGLIYSAVRLILHSSSMLHHPPEDDDRSGITFWLPKSPHRREALAETFENMALAVRAARPETGLD